MSARQRAPHRRPCLVLLGAACARRVDFHAGKGSATALQKCGHRDFRSTDTNARGCHRRSTPAHAPDADAGTTFRLKTSHPPILHPAFAGPIVRTCMKFQGRKAVTSALAREAVAPSSRRGCACGWWQVARLILIAREVGIGVSLGWCKVPKKVTLEKRMNVQLPLVVIDARMLCGFFPKRCMKALTCASTAVGVRKSAGPSTLSRILRARELIPILWIGSIRETANSINP
jgi:hypothetical protein